MQISMNTMRTASIRTLVPILGLAVFSLAANAAEVTYTFTGSWDGMHTWNPGQAGDPTISTSAGGGPEMAVDGLITYDDQTGVVSALKMSQVGTLTSNWDLNPDYPNTPEFDTVTMSNYTWESSGTDLRLLTGTAVCNGATNADCGPGMQYGGNYMGRGGPLENFGPPYALTDWIGASNFDTNGTSNPGGDILDGPGFQGTVSGNTVAIDTITSWNGFVPLAATGTYNLTLGAQVPVPAAVWLFGSALGLLGWARRRQS